MSSKKPPQASVNLGIQANQVSAEVIAVGEGARASKSSGGTPPGVDKAIGQLEAALAGLNLEPPARAGVRDDLATLQAAARSDHPAPKHTGHALLSLTARLKAVGVMLSEVVALAEPVRTLADWLKVPLHLLGL